MKCAFVFLILCFGTFGIFVSSTLIKAGFHGLTLQIKVVKLIS